MSNQRKKGFTLIELMVVIVIIGILAAVAIPKLFGMSAKAKAAEVGPASGTWSKLQSAYYVETSLYGEDIAIAYVKPGATKAQTESSSTANFIYTTATASPKTVGQIQGGTQANFTAVPNAALGDCKATSGTWAATIVEGAAKPTADISGDAACQSLTPNFKSLQ